MVYFVVDEEVVVEEVMAAMRAVLCTSVQSTRATELDAATASLAASLAHASLTVPSDRALSAVVGTSRRHLRPTSRGGAMPLVAYDHAGAAGADAAASALAEEALQR